MVTRRKGALVVEHVEGEPLPSPSRSSPCRRRPTKPGPETGRENPFSVSARPATVRGWHGSHVSLLLQGPPWRPHGTSKKRRNSRAPSPRRRGEPAGGVRGEGGSRRANQPEMLRGDPKHGPTPLTGRRHRSAAGLRSALLNAYGWGLDGVGCGRQREEAPPRFRRGVAVPRWGQRPLPSEQVELVGQGRGERRLCEVDAGDGQGAARSRAARGWRGEEEEREPRGHQGPDGSEDFPEWKRRAAAGRDVSEPTAHSAPAREAAGRWGGGRLPTRHQATLGGGLGGGGGGGAGRPGPSAIWAVQAGAEPGRKAIRRLRETDTRVGAGGSAQGPITMMPRTHTTGRRLLCPERSRGRPVRVTAQSTHRRLRIGPPSDIQTVLKGPSAPAQVLSRPAGQGKRQARSVAGARRCPPGYTMAKPLRHPPQGVTRADDSGDTGNHQDGWGRKVALPRPGCRSVRAHPAGTAILNQDLGPGWGGFPPVTSPYGGAHRYWGKPLGRSTPSCPHHPQHPQEASFLDTMHHVGSPAFGPTPGLPASRSRWQAPRGGDGARTVLDWGNRNPGRLRVDLPAYSVRRRPERSSWGRVNSVVGQWAAGGGQGEPGARPKTRSIGVRAAFCHDDVHRPAGPAAQHNAKKHVGLGDGRPGVLGPSEWRCGTYPRTFS